MTQIVNKRNTKLLLGVWVIIFFVLTHEYNLFREATLKERKESRLEYCMRSLRIKKTIQY